MGNWVLNAGLTLLDLLPMCGASVWLASVCPFPYSKRSDYSLSRTWGCFGMNKCQQGRGCRKTEWKKMDWDRKERKMMKNKVNACASATGQRSTSPSPPRLEGGKDKGRAIKTLCLSLHRLLIYLCSIPGNPCCGRLEAKASNQAVCPKRIHYLK